MLTLQRNLTRSAGLLCLTLAFTSTAMAVDLVSGGYNRKVETTTFEQTALLLVTKPITQPTAQPIAQPIVPGDFNQWLYKQSGQ